MTWPVPTPCGWPRQIPMVVSLSGMFRKPAFGLSSLMGQNLSQVSYYLTSFNTGTLYKLLHVVLGVVHLRLPIIEMVIYRTHQFGQIGPGMGSITNG